MPHAYLNAPELVVLQKCTKVQYGTRREAKLKAELMGKRDGDLNEHGSGRRLVAYKCRICAWWHVGHER